ncbi:MAG: hypothetical protein Q8S84_01890 [bacterium]|nr:hypothetical protein [bacterium]
MDTIVAHNILHDTLLKFIFTNHILLFVNILLSFLSKYIIFETISSDS